MNSNLGQKIIDFFRNCFVDLVCNIKLNLNLYLYKHKFKRTYTIIPIGEFCLPRVMTTFCGLKPKKRQGEKTYPFDLCHSSISANIELIDSKFKDFFDNIRFNKELNQYESEKYCLYLNHDYIENDDVFRNRYNNRIANFYNEIEDSSKFIYFICAMYNQPSAQNVNDLVKAIEKFRKDKFKIIYICCNFENNVVDNSGKSVFINNIELMHINNKGNWANKLKKARNIFTTERKARKIFVKLEKELKKHIFENCT